MTSPADIDDPGIFPALRRSVGSTSQPPNLLQSQDPITFHGDGTNLGKVSQLQSRGTMGSNTDQGAITEATAIKQQATGGQLAGNQQQQQLGLNSRVSFASMVKGNPKHNNGVQGVLGYEKLPPRRKTRVDNKPAIIFSNLELTAANDKLKHSMVLKFSSGRPTLIQIQEHIKQHWHLNGEFIVSFIDPRHVGVYIKHEDDLKTALAKESHIINKCMYRAFRWTPDFDIHIENPVVAVWIRLPGIPWSFYNGALLECIGNELGRFLKVDSRTLGLTHQVYARMCIEIDVSKPLEHEIWIGDSKESGFWQKVLYEGNIAYCNGCGLLGHTVGVCRKANRNGGLNRAEKNTSDDQGKQQETFGGRGTQRNNTSKTWIKMREKEQVQLVPAKEDKGLDIVIQGHKETRRNVVCIDGKHMELLAKPPGVSKGEQRMMEGETLDGDSKIMEDTRKTSKQSTKDWVRQSFQQEFAEHDLQEDIKEKSDIVLIEDIENEEVFDKDMQEQKRELQDNSTLTNNKRGQENNPFMPQEDPGPSKRTEEDKDNGVANEDNGSINQDKQEFQERLEENEEQQDSPQSLSEVEGGQSQRKMNETTSDTEEYKPATTKKEKEKAKKQKKLNRKQERSATRGRFKKATKA